MCSKAIVAINQNIIASTITPDTEDPINTFHRSASSVLIVWFIIFAVAIWIYSKCGKNVRTILNTFLVCLAYTACATMHFIKK